MVSARPPPAPARGRIAYPSATAYTPGDVAHSPAYLKGSEPVQPITSRDSDAERAQGLKTWWKTFRERPEGSSVTGRGVFGVPLAESIDYASVQISTAGQDGALYVWGVVPVVVAKCGLHLKEHATEIEGTFRISGSSKRMRDLQAIFDTGPKYGKNIDWNALPYTTHDVATIFRRFLTQMPEPIIPVDQYHAFRQAYNPEDTVQTCSAYKSLIQSLSPVNRYLLLYVLDLLHVFAKKSDKNLMTAANLSLIFQPGMLSHPDHSMHPREHVLSQHVVEFLIDQQDSFLLGLQPGPNAIKVKDAPPPAPTMTRIDADSFIPSDSDDEAPQGGYYMFEAAPRMQTTSTAKQSSKAPRKQQQISQMVSPSLQSAEIEASDSDDDAPPGGYSVHEGDPAKHQATLLGRSPKNASKPAATPSSTGLSRRRTVPARLLHPAGPGRKHNSREAP